MLKSIILVPKASVARSFFTTYMSEEGSFEEMAILGASGSDLNTIAHEIAHALHSQLATYDVYKLLRAEEKERLAILFERVLSKLIKDAVSASTSQVEVSDLINNFYLFGYMTIYIMVLVKAWIWNQSELILENKTKELLAYVKSLVAKTGLVINIDSAYLAYILGIITNPHDGFMYLSATERAYSEDSLKNEIDQLLNLQDYEQAVYLVIRTMLGN